MAIEQVGALQPNGAQTKTSHSEKELLMSEIKATEATELDVSALLRGKTNDGGDDASRITSASSDEVNCNDSDDTPKLNSSVASFDVRLLLATAATRGEGTNSRTPGLSHSASWVPSSGTLSTAGTSKAATLARSNSLSRIELVRARAKLWRKSSLKTLHASKRSLEERRNSLNCSAGLETRQLRRTGQSDQSTEEHTVSSESCRSDLPVPQQVMVWPQQGAPTQLPLPTPGPDLEPRFPPESPSKSWEEEERLVVDPHLSTLQQICNQLETDLVALRQQLRSVRRRQKWGLLLIMGLLVVTVSLVFPLVWRTWLLQQKQQEQLRLIERWRKQVAPETKILPFARNLNLGFLGR